MKFSRHIGYGVLLGISLMMVAVMSVKAEENEQTPIPVDDQVIEEPDISVTEEMESDNERVAESETVSENASLSSDTSNIEINNGIPVIYLHIDESKGTIEAMNEDPDHNTYCYGTMDFVLPSDDFQYADLQTDLNSWKISNPCLF